MSDKKADKASKEIKREPVEELETGQLDEAHGGGVNIGRSFFTVNVQPDAFITVAEGENFNTANGGSLFNDSPLKK